MKKMSVRVVAAFALVIAGCGPKPHFNPGDVVTIHGTYQNVDGSPYARKTIGVWKFDIEGMSTNNYWFADPDSKDITDSTGAYEFEYKGSDLTWGSGNSKWLILANTDSLAGPVVAMGFFPMTTDESLPTVKLWHGQPQVAVASDTALFTWQGLDDDQGITPDKYSFSAAALAWFDLWQEDSIPSASKTLRIPAFVFQNLALGWRIEAPVNSPIDTAVDFDYISTVNTQSIPSTAPVILSVARPCYAQGSGDSVFTRMTNQIWHEEEFFNNRHPTWFLIDLGQLKYVTAVAVYGLGRSYPAQAQYGGFDVFVADDTTNFGTPVASTSRDKGYFYLQFAPAQGRWVKLARSANANFNVTSLKEIGVFGN